MELWCETFSVIFWWCISHMLETFAGWSGLITAGTLWYNAICERSKFGLIISTYMIFVLTLFVLCTLYFFYHCIFLSENAVFVCVVPTAVFANCVPCTHGLLSLPQFHKALEAIVLFSGKNDVAAVLPKLPSTSFFSLTFANNAVLLERNTTYTKWLQRLFEIVPDEVILYTLFGKTPSKKFPF